MECTDRVQVTGAGANSELSYIIEYKFNLVFIFLPNCLPTCSVSDYDDGSVKSEMNPLSIL